MKPVPLAIQACPSEDDVATETLRRASVFQLPEIAPKVLGSVAPEAMAVLSCG